MNRPWHEKNPMPKNPTTTQRIRWHLEHEALCLPPCSAESTERDREEKEETLGGRVTGGFYGTCVHQLCQGKCTITLFGIGCSQLFHTHIRQKLTYCGVHAVIPHCISNVYSRLSKRMAR